VSRQDVEIAIPACNEENTIATTIASFRSQDYSPALRIVVCANGCTDGTVDVVRRLQNSDRNLILDVTSERGKPNAWNRLREMTTAPYICFADGDVIVPPTSISRMMQHLETNSILAAVGARVVPVTDGA
jgi:cellulose synthase/poly-beta-1,6-N-acetylglucosamine synthase-like glycosyltransferase